MPMLKAIGTANPNHLLRQSDAESFSETFFSSQFRNVHRFSKVFANADIEQRYTSAPLDWFGQPHSFTEKNDLYLKTALKLSQEAIEDCLSNTDVTPMDIDEIVFVSSTGISTPSLDAFLVNEMSLNPRLRRTPMWGLGCAGGAAGLARGFDLASAHPTHRVMVIAVELCSLTFQHGNRTKSNFVATALFGDGAAAALIEGDDVKTNATNRSRPMLRYVESNSRTWPDTLDVMGWKLTETGLDVIFSRDIPTLVESRLASAVSTFLESCLISLDDLSALAAHPGGRKVLDAYQNALSCHPDALQSSRDILRKFGNMSAPTVLFVLKQVLDDATSFNRVKHPYVLAFALGPGFSCEQVLLQWYAQEGELTHV